MPRCQLVEARRERREAASDDHGEARPRERPRPGGVARAVAGRRQPAQGQPGAAAGLDIAGAVAGDPARPEVQVQVAGGAKQHARRRFSVWALGAGIGRLRVRAGIDRVDLPGGQKARRALGLPPTLIGKPQVLLRDPEWRTYVSIIVLATLLVMGVLWGVNEFRSQSELSGTTELETTFRDSLFQVVSILTTTGFVTADFDLWPNFCRALLIALMFIGACAGSTGGGMKVIRHILFVKILQREIEHSFHPSVVRHIRLSGEPITDPELPRNILVYVSLIALVFGVSWLLLISIEPDSTWQQAESGTNRLGDSAAAVAATLNNIGPGLGIVGPTQNYSTFSAPAKLLFTFLMMLGRLELFVILVLVVPSFWRTR